MKTTRKYLLLTFAFIQTALIAQNGDYTIDQQSETYLKHQFLQITPTEVNEFNGSANIFIPFYSIKLNDLEIPIGIRYNSTGIKVDQRATEVGLGWTLEAGGSVTKEINGKYEDNTLVKDYYPFNTMDGGYLSSPYTEEIPDFYRISASGLSGRFFIDKTLNVQEIENIKTADISFVRDFLTSEEINRYGSYAGGMRYYLIQGPLGTSKFKDTKSIKVIKNNFTYNFGEWNFKATGSHNKDENYQGPNYLYSDSYSEESYLNEFSLSEVVDNTSKKKVSFKYLDNAGIDNNPGGLSGSNIAVENVTSIKNRIWDKFVYQTLDDGGFTSNYFNKTWYYSFSLPVHGFVKKLIQTITTDNEIVTFNYEKSREDYTFEDVLFSSPTHSQTINAPLLRSIEIKNKSLNTVIKYIFNYDYFNSGCTNAYLCKRLKLNSIDKIYNNNLSYKESYNFTYNTTTLPKINSNSRDAFGYKSSLSESVVSDARGLPNRPNLYKYVDNIDGKKFDYYSTVNIPNLSPVKVAGVYEQTTSSLNDSKAWTLESITYPTKGNQLFEYEQNHFLWKGNSISGAGLRIKSINLITDNKIEETKYKYSNGEVASLPLVTLKKNFADGPYGTVVTSIPQVFLPKLVTSAGSYVIYPNVEKTLPNGSKISSNYTSYSDYPESEDIKYYTNSNPITSITQNVGIHLFGLEKTGAGIYSNKSFLRGRLKSSYYYDVNNNPVKQIINTYQITTVPLYIPMDSYNYYPTSEMYPEDYQGYINTVNVQPVAKKFNLISSEITSILNSTPVKETKTFTYTNDYNLLKSIKISTPIDDYEKIYLYAFENNNQLPLNLPELRQIKTDEINLKNNKIISNSKDIYSTDSNNLTLPASKQSFDLQNNQQTNLTYDKYDNKGNILQYTINNAISTAIIWGYNQTQPIAKVEGATYAQASAVAGDIVTASDQSQVGYTEANLLAKLDAFRNDTTLKGFQITTYTYKPLIGVSSITPPSGIREVYIYDTANRLQEVRDANGNLLKSYEYHYKP